MTNTLKFLGYDERPAFAPPVRAYHDRCVAMASGVEGTEHSYGSHPLQRLTVYPAAQPSGEVLLVFHGGRFSHGYKEWMAIMAPALHRRGVTLVSAAYRLIPEPFPAGLQDCGAALHWVHANLRIFGGARDAIFIGGHSSGGYYATMVALRPQKVGLGQVPAVAGCISISGLYRMEADKLPGPLLFPDGAEPQTYVDASPVLQDLRAAPAFHISWASNDLPPVPEQSAEMVSALSRAGVPAESLVVQGADHFSINFAASESDGTWMNSVEPFIKRHRAARAGTPAAS